MKAVPVATWTGRPGAQWRLALALAGVLALHLALIVALGNARIAQRAALPAPRVSLRLIAPEPPVAPRPIIEPDVVRRRAPTRTHQAPSTAPTERAPPTTPAADLPSAGFSAPDPAASTAVAQPSLMDSDATRRAIRASARAPSLGDQLAQSRDEPHRPGPNDRLADGVRNAGQGDCLKGEYAGAGMGLLSLPLLAAAALAGRCAK